MKFIIQDWAGNTCFKGIEFESFQDAWEFLYEQFPNDFDKHKNDQDLQEYFVERKES